MPNPKPAALEFLQTRRSRPAKTLRLPAPTHAELTPLLKAALRCPDHGKLEPWRLIVLEKAALTRLAELAQQRAVALNIDPDKIEKGVSQYRDAPLSVAVVSSPVASQKVPHIDQVYSAGAVCLSLLNAALAAGWGANWLSGWASHDREFCQTGLDLDTHEQLAGLIIIGTQTIIPPERPRPDIDALTQWIDH